MADRLRALETDKRDAEKRLEAARIDAGPLDALPDLVPALMDRWRALVDDFEGLAGNPAVEPGELDTARTHLHALLGQVTLKPKRGVLWAYPALNAKGLTEVSPLHIKPVAGARYENYMQIDLDPFPLAV